MKNKEKIEVKYVQEVESDKKMHHWYGGEVAKIDYSEKIKFLICATGDMIGDIFDKNGNSVEHFKDKNDSAVFYNIASKYFKNDEELNRAMFYHDPEKEELSDLELEHYVKFDYSNWWEVFPIVEGELQDIMLCLDAFDIDEAIKEVYKNLDSILKSIRQRFLYNITVMKRKTLRQIVEEINSLPQETNESFISGDEFEAWLKVRKQDSITDAKIIVENMDNIIKSTN